MMILAGKAAKACACKLLRVATSCCKFNAAAFSEGRPKRVGEPLNVLFFGTDDFSVPTLKALHADTKSEKPAVARLDVCCIQMKHLVSSAQKYAEEHGLPTHSWPPDDVAPGQFDIGVVASFGKMLPKRLIESFPRGMLNVHASLLPRWRGASPIVHAIMHGDRETGVSIMEIKPHHFDIGCVLVQRSYPIQPDVSRKDLSEQLANLGAALMLEVLRDLSHFDETKISQDAQEATYAPIIHSSMFEIDWLDMTSQQVWNRYRALCDFGKLQSTWEETNEQVRFDAMVNPGELLPLDLDGRHGDAVPGQAVYLKHKLGRYLCVRCRQGWVSFRKFYYAKRKVMNPLDYYNGFISKHKDSKLTCFVKTIESH